MSTKRDQTEEDIFAELGLNFFLDPPNQILSTWTSQSDEGPGAAHNPNSVTDQQHHNQSQTTIQLDTTWPAFVFDLEQPACALATTQPPQDALVNQDILSTGNDLNPRFFFPGTDSRPYPFEPISSEFTQQLSNQTSASAFSDFADITRQPVQQPSHDLLCSLDDTAFVPGIPEDFLDIELHQHTDDIFSSLAPLPRNNEANLDLLLSAPSDTMQIPENVGLDIAANESTTTEMAPSQNPEILLSFLQQPVPANRTETTGTLVENNYNAAIQQDPFDWLTIDYPLNQSQREASESNSHSGKSQGSTYRISDGESLGWEHLSQESIPSADERAAGSSSGEQIPTISNQLSQDARGVPMSEQEATTSSATSRIENNKTKVTAAANATSVVLKPRKSTQRVRGKLTEEQREKAKLMRQVGNCLRCRVYKLPCDDRATCQKCLDVMGKARTYHEPCYRDKLNRITTARHGNGNFAQANVEFLKYVFPKDGNQRKTIRLKWGLPGGRSVELPGFELTCKRFLSLNNDSHFITWQVNGEVVTLELPPFAADDDVALTHSVETFLQHGRDNVLTYIIEDIDSRGDLLQALSLKEALRYAKKYSRTTTLDLALRIRCASFCSQGWGSIVGTETLGIGELNFNKDGQCGYAAYDRGYDRPLPLSIDHQIDVALLKTIQKYQKKLLAELQKKIFAKNKPWYEVFLTTFVLLSNLEYVHGGSLAFLQSQMKTKSEQSCSFLTREMVEEYDYSASNLLHHFRAVFRGNLAFKAAETDMEHVKQKEDLDDDSVRYMNEVIALLASERHRIQEISTPPGDPLSHPPNGKWLNRLFESVDR